MPSPPEPSGDSSRSRGSTRFRSSASTWIRNSRVLSLMMILSPVLTRPMPSAGRGYRARQPEGSGMDEPQPLAGPVAAELGDGPGWDGDEQCLRYVDIVAGRLLRWWYRTGATS